MASTNQSPFYKQAEAKFLVAQTDEERIKALEEMIKECPKHKSSEKMLANLKTRYKKLKEKLEKTKKSGKGQASKTSIKKSDMQAVIIGQTNTGKSSLLTSLTNAKPKISPGIQTRFTTTYPVQGMMNYSGTNIQLIENPAPESDFYDKSLVNTADTLLILIDNLEQINKIKPFLTNAIGKQIIIFNKIDKIAENEIRKLEATLKSKRYDFLLISTKTKKGLQELKEIIFKSFNKIRVFTKEPGKPKSEKPIILEPNSTVKHVAEKILHGFSDKVKESKVTGPSSKFPNQKVGLQHKLKDLDVVEFKTR